MAAATTSQFCYPVQVLESDHLRVQPIHNDMATAELVHALLDTRKEVYHFLPSDPFPNAAALAEQWLDPVAASPTIQLHLLVVKNSSTFQIGDKTQPGQPAGMIAYLHSQVQHALTEIGWVVIFPEWQRTFVSTHAIGLLLRRALNPSAEGGLGLRRVEWRCHSKNLPSQRAAERMGFVFEGVLRWAIVLPTGKESNGRSVVDGERPGRDTCVYSITWEDWLIDGRRESVEQLMQRPVDKAVLEGTGAVHN